MLQHAEEGEVVAVVAKERHSAGGAIEHVIDQATRRPSGCAWHVGTVADPAPPKVNQPDPSCFLSRPAGCSVGGDGRAGCYAAGFEVIGVERGVHTTRRHF